MNYFVLVIVIVIIILLYVLYKFFSNSGKTLATKVDFNSGVQTVVNVNDTSTRFAYSLWIYVNSWNTTDEKIIMKRTKNNDSTPLFKLKLHQTTPTLTLEMSQNGTSPQQIEITSNFPIQKWCNVCFSVDGNYVDCYLEGKLIKSVKLNKTLATPLSTDPLLIGETGVKNDIYLQGVFYWANSLTPQEVLSKYYNSRGSIDTTKTTSYSATVSLLKNNVEKFMFKLF